jgi:hypothetical protein
MAVFTIKGQSKFHGGGISHSHKMDSCAIGPDRKLLDDMDIKWFHDADDAHPLPSNNSGVSRSGMYAD